MTSSPEVGTASTMGSACSEQSDDDGQGTTVTLSGKDLRDVIRLLVRLTEQTGSLSQLPSTRKQSDASPQELVASARETLARRRRRTQLFGSGMFGEPAWDMLLRLYIEPVGRRFTIAQITQDCGAAASTALRWIDYLEGQRYIQRESHPTDRRSVFVELTAKGRDALNMYFSETLGTGK